jgi:hypothetical protein
VKKVLVCYSLKSIINSSNYTRTHFNKCDKDQDIATLIIALTRMVVIDPRQIELASKITIIHPIMNMIDPNIIIITAEEEDGEEVVADGVEVEEGEEANGINPTINNTDVLNSIIMTTEVVVAEEEPVVPNLITTGNIDLIKAICLSKYDNSMMNYIQVISLLKI